MDIEKVMKALKENLLLLTKETYKDIKPELQKDINDFLSKSQEKIERWSLLLASNSITKDEFEWLLKSQNDLLTLKVVQRAGVSKIKINNIKKAILNTVFQTVIGSL
ncbi:hypothetical protein [Flavobacterium dankookense]|uniref:Uncharacterized protein n=1 Tax=Flavobacterium dankookense TaxID=706186 RepID=A0A4R6QDM7_9FLAO|nr:hypothetical protein [Flavobacterium dankookense]TDP60076.1 hypothetical protein BC748_1049 [Flavobacterium dankookense]